MKYLVTTPTPDFTGEVAGVAFAKGAATVDSVTDRRALEYFRHKGYRIEEATPASGPEQEEQEQDSGNAPKVPARSASKADWVKYVTGDAAGDKRLTDADAQARNRDELAEHVLGPKEG